VEPLVQQAGKDRIIVELPGLRDPERAKAIIRRNAFLEFRITDESRALDRVLPALDRALAGLGVSIGPTATRGAVDRLLGGTGAPDSLVTGQLARLIVPAGDGSSYALPGEYAVPEPLWRSVDSALRRAEVRRLWPRGIDLKWADTTTGEHRLLYALADRPMITGKNLVDARAQTDPLTNAPEVTFSLDHEGGRRLGDGTGRNVGRYMAILLDGEVQGRPPVIESRIEREGRIRMTGRSLAEAQDLAITGRLAADAAQNRRAAGGGAEHGGRLHPGRDHRGGGRHGAGHRDRDRLLRDERGPGGAGAWAVRPDLLRRAGAFRRQPHPPGPGGFRALDRHGRGR
jgi:hypothetical protein